MKNDYVTLELAGIFDIHRFPILLEEDQSLFLSELVPEAPEASVRKLLTFSSSYETDPEFQSSELTLRQKIRILRFLDFESYPRTGNLHSAICSNLLSRFLPSSTRAILRSLLRHSGIEEEDACLPSIPTVHIPLARPHKDVHLIPRVSFFENNLHSKILGGIQKSFARGENLLLIGNQGTGFQNQFDLSLTFFFQVKTS